jgi:hypothetical protein
MKNLNLNQIENLNGGICALFPGGGNSDNNVFNDCFQTCGLGQLLSGNSLPFPTACPA